MKVVHTLVKRVHGRPMCFENHEHASGKPVAIGRDVQRKFLNQSTTCRRVAATEERSNTASRVKDVLWGSCTTMHRLNWGENGVHV